MNFWKLFTRIPLVAVLLASSVALAMKVQTGTPNIDLNLNVLLQARAQLAWNGDLAAQSGGGPGASPWGNADTDFYIRRARLIASGYGWQKFSYYIMFDTPNFGIRGNYTGSTFLQDLHIGYEPFRELAVEMGFLYMPFSYLGLLSSSSTSSIEKGTAILFYNNARGLRETGIQVRWLFLDRRLWFRGGLFSGLHGNQTGTNASGNIPVNPNGRPLLAGTLRFNLIGGDNVYAFPNIYIDGKSHVSVGVAGQYQGKGSNTPITRVNAAGVRQPTVQVAVNDYVAYAADVFADFALPGDMEAVFEGDFVRFDWGSGSDKTGNGIYVEAGYRIGQLEPEVNGYWFNSDSKQNSFLKYAGGINWFFEKHATKLSLEFISQKTGVNLNTSSFVNLLLLQGSVSY